MNSNRKAIDGKILNLLVLVAFFIVLAGMTGSFRESTVNPGMMSPKSPVIPCSTENTTRHMLEIADYSTTAVDRPMVFYNFPLHFIAPGDVVSLKFIDTGEFDGMTGSHEPANSPYRIEITADDGGGMGLTLSLRCYNGSVVWEEVDSSIFTWVCGYQIGKETLLEIQYCSTSTCKLRVNGGAWSGSLSIEPRRVVDHVSRLALFGDGTDGQFHFYFDDINLSWAPAKNQTFENISAGTPISSIPGWSSITPIDTWTKIVLYNDAFLDYLATYSFSTSNDLPTLVNWNHVGNVSVVNKVGKNGAGVQAPHRDVLALNGNASAFQTFGMNQTAGSIDFYCLVSDMADHEIKLQHKIGSTWMDCIMIRMENGTMQAKSGTKFIDARYGPLPYTASSWYEFHVEFNYNNNFRNMAGELLPPGDFNVWVNTALEFANASMLNAPGTIGQLAFTQSLGQSYFDAVDYSWASAPERHIVIGPENGTMIGGDGKVYHEITVLSNATLYVNAHTTLYMDGALVVKPGAMLAIDKGATLNARDGLNWFTKGNVSYLQGGDHMDGDTIFNGASSNPVNFVIDGGTLECDGMYINSSTRVSIRNHALLITTLLWEQSFRNNYKNEPFSASNSTITCSKSFCLVTSNGTAVLSIDHVLFNSPLIWIEGADNAVAKITMTDSTINGVLDFDRHTYGMVKDSKIMAFFVPPVERNLSMYWQNRVFSSYPGATTIGINCPCINFSVYKLPDQSLAKFRVFPATGPMSTRQFFGTAFENYSVQWNAGPQGAWENYSSVSIFLDFTSKKNITILCNLPVFDQGAWTDGETTWWHNVQIVNCTAERKLTVAHAWGDMQDSSALMNWGEWESATTINETIVNCEFVSIKDLLPATMTNWTGWSLGNLPLSSTSGFYTGGWDLPKNPNRKTIITYVNCWFPADYRAYFGFPGGSEMFQERWDSAIYREQYTYIDCHVDASSQVVFFGKGSAVVSAMAVTARGSPASWQDCQARMRWYENFSTTNATLTIPSRSINVTLVVPGNCYYGQGLAVYRGSSKILSLTSAWINRTFTMPIPSNGNYSITFYATFQGKLYQTSRNLGFVLANGAAYPPRFLSSPPDQFYNFTSTGRTRNITWTCLHDHPQSIVVTLNGNIVISNNATTNVTYPALATPYNGIVNLQFRNLKVGEYVATIAVNGTDNTTMSDTVFITVLPDNSTPFTSSSSVMLPTAGTYASDVIQQPITISGSFKTLGPISITVGTWTKPPYQGPTTNGTYFAIYANNPQNIGSFTIIVPLPPGYEYGDNLKLLTWNGSMWVDTGFPVSPIGPPYTTASIAIYHLSIYALVIYNPFSFARHDLTILNTMVNATSKASWSKPWEKQAMLDKISIVSKLLDNGYYAAAYDMLLHDIKPKLTGLKTDENGTPWGNGVFKHPWIVDPAFRSMLRGVIDAALADIKACQVKTIQDALGPLGCELLALKNLIDGHLSGCKKETSDRLISNVTTLYLAMVARFKQGKTVNCTVIVKFHSIIARIDRIARNALIRRECNDIFSLLGNITRAEFPGFITMFLCYSHHRDRDHDRHCCGSDFPAVHRNRQAYGESEPSSFFWYNQAISAETPFTGHEIDYRTSPGYEVHSAPNGKATACMNVTSDQAHHHAAGDGDVGDHSRDDHAR